MPVIPQEKQQIKQDPFSQKGLNMIHLYNLHLVLKETRVDVHVLAWKDPNPIICF